MNLFLSSCSVVHKVSYKT
uniref:Uncharacterized protein n=1 Tax=Rhizophora mucronata TaxID=61149 RepID=A0A2P2PKX3_RHIMU